MNDLAIVAMVVASLALVVGVGFVVYVTSSSLDIDRLARVAHVFRHYLAPRFFFGRCCDRPPDEVTRTEEARSEDGPPQLGGPRRLPTSLP